MTTISSSQHLSALQFPWHAKRGRPTKMLQVSTPCSSSHTSRVTSPVDKENLRRQIVGLAVKKDNSDTHRNDLKSAQTKISGDLQIKIDAIQNTTSENEPVNGYQTLKKVKSPRAYTTKRTRLYAQERGDNFRQYKMPLAESQEVPKNGIPRSKTPILKSDKSKPKIVRFRMDEFSIGKQKAPIVNITDAKESKHLTNGNIEIGQTYDYEVRGSAISVRKEGLKGLLAQKEIYTENEKRQNSLQASLKIFRRRIKLNQEKFIQPGETTTEDYVIHTRSPIFDLNGTAHAQEESPVSRPLSSDEHVRILRSALHNKHHGATNVTKQTDIDESAENYKNIKCSYRLPENPNWGKEVSFKDIKDDSIPNVKTYVLAEETHPHAKFKRNNIQSSVTLNTHNLNVHNSITQVNGQKMKVGDSEISFDPRFLDWLEDSFSNAKLYKSSTFLSDDTIDCSTPSVKRRITVKT